MKREEEIAKAADEAFKTTDFYIPTFEILGFMLGANWADENPKSPWISVEDDLPCNHEELIDKNFKGNFQKTLFVVVWYDNHEDLDCMISENGEWRWLSKFRNSYTHWMLIPEPPKK